ncbi:MAG: YkgJ family cysteine cluster protein [Bacillota bacterium]
MSGSVEVIPVELKGGPGYDLIIRHAGATVQDYLDAVNDAFEKIPLARLWLPGGICSGCDLCCRDRIPLTNIDLLQLSEFAGKQGEGHTSWHRALEGLAKITVSGKAADITMRTGDDGRCHLLDAAGRCRVYPQRPLVCQTFSCAPLTPRAARLRETLVNSGEDELVRQWLLDARERGAEPTVHEAYRPEVCLSDWELNAFSNCAGYAQVPIKDLCSPDLWRALTGG